MTTQALAEALTKMIEDPDFAESVVSEGSGALAAFDLSQDEAGELVSDAQHLAAETSGFARGSLNSFKTLQADIGGIGSVAGPRLASAIGRAPAAGAACGEHGCCSWENGVK